MTLMIVRIYLLPVGMFYGLTRKKESQTKIRKPYLIEYIRKNLKLLTVRIYLLPVGMFYGLTRKKESQIKHSKNNLIKCYQLFSSCCFRH
jgi:hypothetical protein